MSGTMLDCRGLACPEPVLRVKDALERGAAMLAVVVDNEAACQNVQRFAGTRGCRVEVHPQGEGVFRLDIRAGQGQVPAAASGGCCCEAPAHPGGLVYVIASDTMGRGDDLLGRSLLQTYIQTIAKVEPLPQRIIFYNSGVRVVATESDALAALQALQAKGVEILVCGTCLDFYQLKSAIQVGQISNMFAIMDATIHAAKVVSPL